MDSAKHATTKLRDSAASGAADSANSHHPSKSDIRDSPKPSEGKTWSAVERGGIRRSLEESSPDTRRSTGEIRIDCHASGNSTTTQRRWKPSDSSSGYGSSAAEIGEKTEETETGAVFRRWATAIVHNFNRPAEKQRSRWNPSFRHSSPSKQRTGVLPTVGGRGQVGVHPAQEQVGADSSNCSPRFRAVQLGRVDGYPSGATSKEYAKPGNCGKALEATESRGPVRKSGRASRTKEVTEARQSRDIGKGS